MERQRRTVSNVVGRIRPYFWYLWGMCAHARVNSFATMWVPAPACCAVVCPSGACIFVCVCAHVVGSVAVHTTSLRARVLETDHRKSERETYFGERKLFLVQHWRLMLPDLTWHRVISDVSRSQSYRVECMRPSMERIPSRAPRTSGYQARLHIFLIARESHPACHA